MNDTIQKLKNNLSRLVELIYSVNTNIATLETIRACMMEDEVNMEVFNQTKAFWHMVIRGIFIQNIMDLSRIFDCYEFFKTYVDSRLNVMRESKDNNNNLSKYKREKATISLPVTFVMCEQNKHCLIRSFTITQKEREKDGRALYDNYNIMQNEICALLSKAGEYLDELKKLRDKSFAHLDYPTYFGGKDSLFLGMESIKELAKIAEEIVDIYSNAFFDHSFEFYNDNDQEDERLLFEYARVGYQHLLKEAGIEV